MLIARKSNRLLFATLALSAGCGTQHAMTDGDATTEPSPHHQATEAQQALQGGTSLNTTQTRRAGVVDISIPLTGNGCTTSAQCSPGFGCASGQCVATGGCTGTILSTSAFDRRSWVLTAGHCFCGASGPPSIFRPGPSGTRTMLANGGTVFIHPSYNPCGPIAAYDVAVVRFDTPVLSATSVSDVREFRRPIWATPPAPGAFAAMGTGNNNEVMPGNLLCQESASPTSDGSLRWASASFAGAINWNLGTTSPFSPSPSFLNGGDSGGPWMSVVGGVTQEGLLENGAIMAASSFSSCVLGAYSFEASGTFAPSTLAFLRSTVGSDLRETTGGWTRSCFIDWCEYSPIQQASLIATLSF